MNNIPTTEQIYAIIMADYQNRLGVNLPNWGKYIIRTFALINAHLFYLLYIRLSFVYRNILPDTADSTEHGGLLQRFGMIYLQRMPYKATQGVYTVTGTGTNGATIPAGRMFVANRNNVNFTNDVSFTFAPGSNEFQLRSLTSGSSTRLNIGDQIQIVSPIGGVENIFVVTNEVIEPTDAEPLESYRSKILTAMRYKSRGGAASDYRFWATQVVGVRNAYPYTGTPLPNVNLFIESETNDGVPSPALINDVQNYIETRRPLGIIVNYLPVEQRFIEISIQGSTQALTPADKQQITDAIRNYLDRKRPYIQAIDGSYRNDIINLNEIISVVQSVKPSMYLGNISMTVDGSLHVNYMLDLGNIPYLSNVIF